MSRRESYHVYPIHEQHRHILDGTFCPCDPKVEHYEDRDLVIHNTAEEAKKKAN
jgi:hypothetical protein